MRDTRADRAVGVEPSPAEGGSRHFPECGPSREVRKNFFRESVTNREFPADEGCGRAVGAFVEKGPAGAGGEP